MTRPLVLAATFLCLAAPPLAAQAPDTSRAVAPLAVRAQLDSLTRVERDLLRYTPSTGLILCPPDLQPDNPGACTPSRLIDTRTHGVFRATFFRNPRPFRIVALPAAAPRPGPKADIAFTLLARGTDLDDALARANLPLRVPSHVGFDSITGYSPRCRIDLTQRCTGPTRTLAERLYEAFESIPTGDRTVEDRFINVAPVIGTRLHVLSIDGDLAFATLAPDGSAIIGSLVALDLRRSNVAPEYVEYARLAEDRLYLLLGNGISVGEGSILSTSPDLRRVHWISPKLTARGSFGLHKGKLYSGYGFTALPDYLYEIDAATGAVTGREPVATAPHYVDVVDEHLLVELYDGGAVFALGQ